MTDKYIIIAPYSNDYIRDWPPDHFKRLIELCVEGLDLRVLVVGTREQRESANNIIRGLPASHVENKCGLLTWSELQGLVSQASAVVANNSGVAHLSSGLQVPTICIFGGSHSPYEWMPRGPRVVILTKRTVCAPCANGSYKGCPYQKRCLTEIEPDQVYTSLSDILAERLPRQKTQAREVRTTEDTTEDHRSRLNGDPGMLTFLKQRLKAAFMSEAT